MGALTDTSAWKALEAHQRTIAARHMRDLFADDPGRFDRFSVGLDGVFLDYSKNRITEETMALLMALARAADVEGWRQGMVSGEPVNVTEDRPALHTALRNRSGRPVKVMGRNVMPEVDEGLRHMAAFASAVRDGTWRGHTGRAIADIVHIGIGGSVLGPALAVAALSRAWRPRAPCSWWSPSRSPPRRP
jgi:glucose-6-phosphate isomerase